jgi:hypothetical protein
MPSRIPEAEARQVMLNAGLEPLEPYPGSGKPWRCRCLACHTEGTPRYLNVKRLGRGCVPCGIKRRAMTRRNNPDDMVNAMKAAGATPLEPYPGSGKPWRCRCDNCGKTISPMYLNVKKRGSACRFCAGYWDPEDFVALMREHGFEPLEPYPGSNTPWKSKCTTCGWEVSPRVLGIKHRGYGCLRCARMVVDPEGAAALMRAAGLEPVDPYVNSGDPWRCRCTTCGEVVTPSYDRVKRGSSCAVCATYGFDPVAPARVYLIQHPDLSVAKIGITGQHTKYDRLSQHEELGWEVLGTWEFATGKESQQVEGTVLSWWRDELEAPQALTSEDMPQRGQTETAWLADVDIDETIAFIERLIAPD